MAGQPPATIGMLLSQIETPALIIDLEVLEENIAKLSAILEASDHAVSLRPHAKAHKSVEIAKLQIAAGAIGVCCQTVGEAEAMIEGGIRDVLLSNEVVGLSKATRLAALAHTGKITVCIDNTEQVNDLSRAATNEMVHLHILVEIDVGAARCGVQPGEEAVALARYITTKPGLRFAGIQAYNGSAQHLRKPQERAAATQQTTSLAQMTVTALAEAGLACAIVTGGGTGTFEDDLSSGVYTELQCGSYVLMDNDYAKNETPVAFKQSLFVLATIISTAVPRRAVCDAGLKALSVDSGLPEVYNKPDIIYQTASDEHGTLQTKGEQPAIGSRLLLTPGHCDPTVNMHDWLVPIRDGKVQAIWKVARAR